MNAEVYSVEGNKKEEVQLPHVFSSEYRPDLIRRALLSEQSEKFQPQGHAVLAGLQTTATYVGTYSGYRRGRHMGIAIRPRQKLGGGAMGDVRRIPSSVKGKRAHPHMIEKRLVERINKREYLKAISSAIAGCTKTEIIRKNHPVEKPFPVVVEDSMEKVSKASDLSMILEKLGFAADMGLSHKPRLSTGRKSQKRHFRKSVLIVVNDKASISRAGRNIPGIDVADVKGLTAEQLAPGAMPRPTIWTKGAIHSLENALKEM